MIILKLFVNIIPFLFHIQSIKFAVTQLAKLHTTPRGLAVGRGFTKAWTGGELQNTCKVSHEPTPRLPPNRSLDAALYAHIFLNAIWILKVKC